MVAAPKAEEDTERTTTEASKKIRARDLLLIEPSLSLRSLLMRWRPLPRPMPGQFQRTPLPILDYQRTTESACRLHPTSPPQRSGSVPANPSKLCRPRVSQTAVRQSTDLRVA